MKTMILATILLAFPLASFAKKDPAAEKQAIVNKMVTSCKAELDKAPKLADTTDSEAVWRNLEDKEHSKVAFSKKCHEAHEKYEGKYHKDEEANEEHEHKE
jgi:hypothetical protein